MHEEYVEGLSNIFNPLDIVTVFITCVAFNIIVYIITVNRTWHVSYMTRTVSSLDFEIYLIISNFITFKVLFILLLPQFVHNCKTIFINTTAHKSKYRTSFYSVHSNNS